MKGLTRLGIAAMLVGVLVFGAGPAFATHVECGDFIFEDTTLDSDLIDCPGNGLAIGADDVNINLNGHVIDGIHYWPGELGTAGVANYMYAGYDGLTVRNGTVQQFTVGIRHGSRPTEEERPVGGRIENVTAMDNWYGIGTVAPDVVVRNNVLLRNYITGIGGGSIIAGNRVTGGQRGIFVGGSGSDVEHNQVQGAEDGMILVGSGHNVRQNHVQGSLFDGFLVYASEITMSKNVATGNGDDGIHLLTAGNTLSKNRADDNADLGIYAVPGTIDGGKNRARGNGNPAQCVNVFCK